jgi:hypothetical protein
MHQYNCIGCHEIENRGGFIRKYYEQNPTLAPPILNGEGEKVQSNWLYGFLNQPVPIRPWLQVRMPTFGFSAVNANALVDYFTGLSKVQNPYVYFGMPGRCPKKILKPRASWCPRTISIASVATSRGTKNRKVLRGLGSGFDAGA